MAPNMAAYVGARSGKALLSPWYQITPAMGKGVSGAIMAL
jgi:hypothetical protein